MLDFLKFEKIAFAHSLSQQNYRYATSNQGYNSYHGENADGGVLEIGFVEENPLLLTVNGETHEIKEEGIFIIPPNTPFSVLAKQEGRHRHTGVEFLIQVTEVAEGEAKIPLALPLYLEPSEHNREIISAIQRIAAMRLSSLQLSFFEECEYFMQLIRKINQRILMIEKEGLLSPGNIYICKRVKTIISNHISEELSVSDIAARLGISKNYLTTVFSRTEGLPLTEFMNRLRVHHMEALIHKYNSSLSDAAPQVGIRDLNYASRLFKKYVGISFSDYKKRMNHTENDSQ